MYREAGRLLPKEYSFKIQHMRGGGGGGDSMAAAAAAAADGGTKKTIGKIKLDMAQFCSAETASMPQEVFLQLKCACVVCLARTCRRMRCALCAVLRCVMCCAVLCCAVLCCAAALSCMRAAPERCCLLAQQARCPCMHAACATMHATHHMTPHTPQHTPPPPAGLQASSRCPSRPPGCRTPRSTRTR
jgi:hypothetical protein